MVFTNMILVLMMIFPAVTPIIEYPTRYYISTSLSKGVNNTK